MRVSILATCVLSIGLVSAAEAWAAPFVFTTIDFPAPGGTTLLGINNAGTIVGNGAVANSLGRGFTYSGGTVSVLSAPPNLGAIGDLAAFGINNAGAVAGYLQLPTVPLTPGADTKIVGFVQDANSFRVLDLNVFDTEPHAINVAGNIVGEFSGPSPGSIGAFIYSNGVTRRGPGSPPNQDFYPAIRNRGINDAGHVVGTYRTSSGIGAGFLFRNGTTTQLQAPNTIGTSAFGINNQDDIVGDYATGRQVGFGYVDIKIHGYLETGGSFLAIDVPGAVSTTARAINDRGDIVGDYLDAGGVSHGFLATRPTDVPEPASAAVLGAGLLALLAARRRRRPAMPPRPGTPG